MWDGIERRTCYVSRMRLVHVVLLLATGCASSGAPNPATAARDARRASIAACNAYDAAVRMGLHAADGRADWACAATRGVCADVELDVGGAP